MLRMINEQGEIIQHVGVDDHPDEHSMQLSLLLLMGADGTLVHCNIRFIKTQRHCFHCAVLTMQFLSHSRMMPCRG